MTRQEILDMPAGRKLDALVAEKCLGLKVLRVDPSDPQFPMLGDLLAIKRFNLGTVRSRLLNYSTDLNAAWDALAVKYGLSIISVGSFHEVTNEKLKPKYLRVVYDPIYNKIESQGDCVSLAEALCKACLIAELGV